MDCKLSLFVNDFSYREQKQTHLHNPLSFNVIASGLFIGDYLGVLVTVGNRQPKIYLYCI